MQGNEPTECIEAALWDIDAHIRGQLRGGGLRAKACWMLDAAGTVKRAVRNVHQQNLARARPPNQRSRARTKAHPSHDDGGELKVGMCRRHVYDAVRVKIGDFKKNGELPQDIDETEVLLFTHAHVVHTHTHTHILTHSTRTCTVPHIIGDQTLGDGGKVCTPSDGVGCGTCTLGCETLECTQGVRPQNLNN